MDKFLSIGEASKYLSVSIQTLRRWDESGKLKSVKTQGGHRKYLLSDLENITQKSQGLVVGYTRVKSAFLMKEQVEQVNYINDYCSKEKLNPIFINDYGFGFDYSRQGLKRLITLIEHDKVDSLIIPNNELMLGPCHEIFQLICNIHNVKIICLNKEKSSVTKRLYAEFKDFAKEYPEKFKKKTSKIYEVILNTFKEKKRGL